MKVLITEILHEDCVKLFKDAGMEVIFAPSTAEGVILDISRDVDAFLVGHARITRKIINSANKLKVIGRLGVGLENVDVAAATERGIPVTFAGEALAESVAEHAICGMLALAKGLIRANQTVREGKWRNDFMKQWSSVELYGKTLGLIGLGRIGRRVAKMAQAFTMKTVIYDPYVPSERIRELGGEPVKDLESLLKESDVVTIHVPLTKETHHLIGERELNLMKKNAFLINTARGAIVDTAALAEALSGGKIAGAALDVFEEEPVSLDNPLLKLQNVILSPHSAWYTTECYRRLSTTVSMDVLKVLKGEPSSRAGAGNIANPEVFQKALKVP